MTQTLTLSLAKLRTCVAFLGEKDQQNWWPCSFLSRSGEAFLSPVFPKTSLLARINGAGAAAQVTHDEHIGVGDVFHLFRLPENVEHDISQLLTSETSLNECFASEENAYMSLAALAGDPSAQGVGPLLIDQNQIDQTLVAQMAAAYLFGLKNNQAVYPYYRGSA